MPDLLEREAGPLTIVAQRATSVETVERDEGPARAELRRQIGKLDRELSGLVAAGLGRVVVPHRVAAAGPPRLLDLGELERVRDALAVRIAEAQQALAEQ